MLLANSSLRRAAFDMLHLSGANRLLRPAFAGRGVVLMLHRVRPSRPDAFQPNRFLEITPEFFERSIALLLRRSYEFVALDEARRRLLDRDFGNRFAAITFDDGLRDVAQWAAPILRRYGIPYTVFVTTSFADGDGYLWWDALEHTVAANTDIRIGGRMLPCRTIREKYAAFAALRDLVLAQRTRREEDALVRELSQRHRYDVDAATRSACMDWQELRELAADPLVTIGSHTISHSFLPKLRDEDVWDELQGSRAHLESKLDRPVTSLAYPYGSADAIGPREIRMASQAGYSVAVTTRSGVLAQTHRNALLELPRIAVDGLYQKERHFDALVSGVAPAAWQQIKRATSRVAALRSSRQSEGLSAS